MVPCPLLSAEFTPVVESSRTAWNPSVVVETAASSKDFAAGVGLFDSSVLGSVDHGGLVCPIMLAAPQLERTSRGGDGVNVLGISDPCFDHQDIDLWIFSQTTGHNAAGSTTFQAEGFVDQYLLGSFRGKVERGHSMAHSPPTTMKSKLLGASARVLIVKG